MEQLGLETEQEIVQNVELAMFALSQKHDKIITWDELVDEYENIAKVMRIASEKIKELRLKKEQDKRKTINKEVNHVNKRL